MWNGYAPVWRLAEVVIALAPGVTVGRIREGQRIVKGLCQAFMGEAITACRCSRRIGIRKCSRSVAERTRETAFASNRTRSRVCWAVLADR